MFKQFTIVIHDLFIFILVWFIFIYSFFTKKKSKKYHNNMNTKGKQLKLARLLYSDSTLCCVFFDSKTHRSVVVSLLIIIIVVGGWSYSSLPYNNRILHHTSVRDFLRAAVELNRHRRRCWLLSTQSPLGCLACFYFLFRCSV